MADRRLAAAGALGVAAIAVGGVVVLSSGGEDGDLTASQSTATTTIRQQDLVESESVDGTLGYSDARTVVNRLAGTVTWTPKVGSVVRTNRRLYEVDGEPVYLLDGSVPAYRTLRPGLTGDDVRQFERNMRRLGMDAGHAMTIDGTWDAGTTAAARRWQERKGLDEDGTIEKGRIVFQPGSRRVSAIALKPGASASGGAEGGGTNRPAALDEVRAGAGTNVLVAASSDRWVTRGYSVMPAGSTADPPRPTTPAPAATTPAPATTTPAPVTTTPAPATTTPAPATTTPARPAPCQQQQQQSAAKPSSGASARTPARESSSGNASANSGTGATDADVSSELMTTTSTRRIVAVDLEATKQSLARQGAAVVVELPDGRTVRGTIATVGKVAQKKATTQDEDPPATIKLVIKLAGSTGTGLDQAPVDVRLERRRAKDALTVAVTALLARAGGAFAVEVRDGTRRRVVEVQTGIYTDSDVEIRGEGLRPGLTVTNSGI